MSTEPFLKDAAVLFTEEEVNQLHAYLACNPDAGDVIPGTGGVRKLRFAFGGRGKRGGARIIYFYYNNTMPLYLLAAFAKNAKINLTQAEKQMMKLLVKQLVRDDKKAAQLVG